MASPAIYRHGRNVPMIVHYGETMRSKIIAMDDLNQIATLWMPLALPGDL
jgi:hypothetical protein